MSDVKYFISCQIIKAEPMIEADWLRSQDDGPTIGIGFETSGYKVTDSEGNITWQPKDRFEKIHREVTEFNINDIAF